MSTQTKICYLVCCIAIWIGCNTNDEQAQFNEGKEIFYSRCTSCHLVKGSVDVDTALRMSSVSLQKMSSLPLSSVQLKSQLMDSMYHEAVRNDISEKEVESIRYFIRHSFDPKP